MLRERYFSIHEQVVREKVQPPRRRNCRIEHAHCPRRRASRIHEDLSARLFLLLVQHFKRFSGHHQFAGSLIFFSTPASTRSGVDRIVFTFGVTSSPVVPSPRVAPRTSTPSSYCSEM